MPLAEVITLPVDVANNGTLVNTQANLFEGVPGRKEYHFAAHSFTMRDQLIFTRSLPKANGNFAGTRKASVKITKDQMVPGVDASTDVKAPGIIEISSSLPVGFSPSSALELRQRCIAILDSLLIIDVQEKCEV